MIKNFASLPMLLLLSMVVVGQRRAITVTEHRDPPIEIVSIDLNGEFLSPGVEFNSPDGWTEGLHIKVRNNTEEHITHIEVLVIIPSRTDPDVAALTADFIFGNLQGTESLQPGASVVLKHVGSTGDNVPGSARLLITNVLWNGDDSLRYDGGGIRQKQASAFGEPPTYRAITLPVSKYRYPSWFQPSARFLKVAALPPVYCNQKLESNSFKYCTHLLLGREPIQMLGSQRCL